jgi:nitroreductase
MSFVRNTLRKILAMFRLEFNFLFDYLRFKQYYSKESDIVKSKKNLEAWILQDKHRIEKALSLPKTKPYFGEAVILRLVNNLNEYSGQFESNNIYYFGVGALKAYEEYHKKIGGELPTFLVLSLKKINSTDFDNPKCRLVGVEGVSKAVRLDYDEEFFKQFVESRHSCRDYLNQQVESNEINKAIKLAIQAPSVCNRQHWKVNIFSGEKKEELLALQNGNAGFTANIPNLAVISSELSAFYNEDERNQPYTDGGIFAMNLMYAFHSLGISSCALNWCNSFVNEKKLYKLGYIDESEAVIMFIAFGYANPEGVYAKSPRSDSSEFYKIH